MDNLMTEFRSGYLQGRSYRLKKAPIFTTRFDLAFTASSWDRRCTMLLNSENVEVGKTFCFLPKDRDLAGLRDRHDRAIIQFWTSHSEDFFALSGPSASVEKILEGLQPQLAAVLAQRRTPLRALIDISACPRYLSLALLGLLLRGAYCSSVYLFYGEGTYASAEPLDVAFTGGRWRTVPVPPFFGKYDGSLPKSYLISTGFESGKTMRAVSQAEPDKVALLVPSPGFVDEYDQRSKSEAERIADEFSIPKGRILNAPAGDCVAAWKALSGAAIYDSGENLHFLCAGTKAHSFGLALQCLCNRNVTLLYIVPDEHKVLDVEPSKTQWLFELTDLTAL